MASKSPKKKAAQLKQKAQHPLLKYAKEIYVQLDADRSVFDPECHASIESLVDDGNGEKGSDSMLAIVYKPSHVIRVKTTPSVEIL